MKLNQKIYCPSGRKGQNKMDEMISKKEVLTVISRIKEREMYNQFGYAVAEDCIREVEKIEGDKVFKTNN